MTKLVTPELTAHRRAKPRPLDLGPRMSLWVHRDRPEDGDHANLACFDLVDDHQDWRACLLAAEWLARYATWKRRLDELLAGDTRPPAVPCARCGRPTRAPSGVGPKCARRPSIEAELAEASGQQRLPIGLGGYVFPKRPSGPPVDTL